jgi:hypothetical protein
MHNLITIRKKTNITHKTYLHAAYTFVMQMSENNKWFAANTNH